MRLNTQKIDMEIKRLGWNKRRLAREMGMHPQAIYRIFKGDGRRSYTFKTVEKFAKALACDPKDLII